MGALSPTHWLILIGVLVLLFGAKRLPDAARSLGRSARILKAEVRETTAGSDDEPPAPPAAAVAPVALPPVVEPHTTPAGPTPSGATRATSD